MGVFQQFKTKYQKERRETGRKDIFIVTQVCSSKIDSSVVVSSVEASRSRLSHPFVLSSYDRRPVKHWATSA